MDALDGNAIAATLAEVFGGEMTSAVATCATCGTSRQLAEYAVCLGGPGVVVRCRQCQNVVMVIAEVGGLFSVDASGLSTLGAPA